MNINKLLFFNELEELKLPKNDYVIGGSCPLVIRGIRKENSDIDIIVTKELWNDLIKVYPISIKNIGGQTREFLLIGHIDLSYSMVGFFDDCKELIERADIVNGYKFINLEDTIFWKNYLHRDKDIKDIEMINQYIKEKNN